MTREEKFALLRQIKIIGPWIIDKGQLELEDIIKFIENEKTTKLKIDLGLLVLKCRNMENVKKLHDVFISYYSRVYLNNIDNSVATPLKVFISIIIYITATVFLNESCSYESWFNNFYKGDQSVDVNGPSIEILSNFFPFRNNFYQQVIHSFIMTDTFNFTDIQSLFYNLRMFCLVKASDYFLTYITSESSPYCQLIQMLNENSVYTSAINIDEPIFLVDFNPYSVECYYKLFNQPVSLTIHVTYGVTRALSAWLILGDENALKFLSKLYNDKNIISNLLNFDTNYDMFMIMLRVFVFAFKYFSFFVKSETVKERMYNLVEYSSLLLGPTLKSRLAKITNIYDNSKLNKQQKYKLFFNLEPTLLLGLFDIDQVYHSRLFSDSKLKELRQLYVVFLMWFPDLLSFNAEFLFPLDIDSINKFLKFVRKNKPISFYTGILRKLKDYVSSYNDFIMFRFNAFIQNTGYISNDVSLFIAAHKLTFLNLDQVYTANSILPSFILLLIHSDKDLKLDFTEYEIKKIRTFIFLVKEPLTGVSIRASILDFLRLHPMAFKKKVKQLVQVVGPDIVHYLALIIAVLMLPIKINLSNKIINNYKFLLKSACYKVNIHPKNQFLELILRLLSTVGSGNVVNDLFYQMYLNDLVCKELIIEDTVECNINVEELCKVFGDNISIKNKFEYVQTKNEPHSFAVLLHNLFQENNYLHKVKSFLLTNKTFKKLLFKEVKEV